MQDASDAGMAVDFSPSSSAFATASQDGLLSVYDVRASGRQLARMQCRQATRCVRFSPSCADLLVCTEHASRAHVVCTRSYSTFQTLHLAGDLSGAAFTPDGMRLLVGVADCSIEQWRIDLEARMSFAEGEIS